MNMDETLRALAVANAEIAEALSHLSFALNMPPHEHRNMKIAAAVESLDRATTRLRVNVLGQQP